MSQPQLSLDEFTRAVLAEERTLSPHPSLEDLAAYHDERLPQAELEAVRTHLSQCRECCQTVLDMASLNTLEPVPEPRVFPDRPVAERPPAWAGLLAAVLGIAVLGLAWWNHSLRRDLIRTSGPRANVHSVGLVPAGEDVARAGGGHEVQIPPGMDHVLFYLNRAPLGSYRTYRAEVLDGQGEILAQLSVQPAPEGNFTIELPRPSLPSGAYRILLYGTADREPALLATYPVEILDAGTG